MVATVASLVAVIRERPSLKHFGPLLLVASGKPLQVDCDGEMHTLPAGCQVCIVDLLNVRRLLVKTGLHKIRRCGRQRDLRRRPKSPDGVTGTGCRRRQRRSCQTCTRRARSGQ